MPRRARLAVVVFATIAVVIAGAPAAVPASHGTDPIDHAITPGDRTPGASGVSYTFEAKLEGNFAGDHSGIRSPDRITFALPAASVTGCTPGLLSNPYTLAIEKRTGDGGSYQRQEYSPESASFEGGTATFTLPEGAADYTVGNILILELNGCVTNPGEAGWYQGDMSVEGQAFGSDESLSVSMASHYVAFCPNCSSNDDGRDALGPPPSEATPTPTASPTPAPSTPTPTPTPTATPAPPDPGPTPTRTPEPAAPTPTEPAATPSPTPAPGDDGGNPFGREFFGTDPLVVVAVVAAVSIALAVFGATRL